MQPGIPIPEGVIIEEIEDEEVGYLDMDREPNMEMSSSMAMMAEEEALDEVVVIAYGVDAERKSLSKAVVVVVVVQEGQPITPNQSVVQQLAGRVAGVQVTHNNGSVGSGSQIVLRGSSSLIGQANPLIIIDGYMADNVQLSELNPQDINSITVLKGAKAGALYGSRAANGVLLINTKTGTYYPQNYDAKVQDNYATYYIAPRKFATCKEFYSPVYMVKSPEEERTDFRETVYWNPLVSTNRNGEAKVSFYTSDAITAFRITAEGISTTGLPGREEEVYTVNQPLSLEASIPPYLLFEDEVQLPVLISNSTDQNQQAVMNFQLPEVFKYKQLPDSVITLTAGQTKTIYLNGTIANTAGQFPIRLSLKSDGYQDKIEQNIEVLPKGFPVEVNYSGNELDKSFSFRLTDPVPGSVQASFKAYPNVVDDIFDGIDRILRQPHGCFEQVSSSTYPNVLALQLMESTRMDRPDAKEKVLQYIESGYKRLAAYETKQDGFEWYGKTPPHEGLSAYGLLELTEMAKVYPKVSEKLLNRTRNWLLSRRDGKGSFNRNAGKYGFSGASEAVTSAYIVYAFAETGGPLSTLALEYQTALAEATTSKDAYRLGLLANAAYAFGDTNAGDKLLTLLEKQIKGKGLAQIDADHSIVRSYGQSIRIEVASLYALALLKNPANLAKVKPTIDYILQARGNFGFGSTQGTVMTLTALSRWATLSSRTTESGTIALALNQSPWASSTYPQNQQGEILLASLENKLVPGKQQVQVKFDQTSTALPYTFNASWTSYTPASSADCRVALSTELSTRESKVGETVRLTSQISNLHEKGVPQTVALVGIPSGLSLQAWQLKELQEKEAFDYYEISGNFVVFYFRELGPEQQFTIHLDLKADIPGKYQAPASSTYLYYTPEYKNWAAGTQITIRP